MSRVFEHNYEVCSCHHVSLGEIFFAIKEKNARTLEEIQRLTDLGKQCTFCVCKENDFARVKKKLYCQEILDKLIQ